MQSANWAPVTKLARSEDPARREAFCVLRLDRVLDSALENTPDGSATRPHVSLGLWWWERDADLAYGEHPGCDTLRTQEGNRRLVRTLVSACEGLANRREADREATDVLVGLRALVAVAAGPDEAAILDQPIDANLVFDVLEKEGGVDRARFLLTRLRRVSGREIDGKFARFRQPGAPAVDGWPPARSAAFAAATRAAETSANLTLDGLLRRFGSDPDAPTSGARAALLAEAEQNLVAVRAVLEGDITTAASVLLEEHTRRRPSHLFEKLERLFFERFFFRPAASPLGARREKSSRGLLDDLEIDERASRTMSATNFLFSWSLLPGVGELRGGRDVAWNTLRAFCYVASERPAHEFARHARTLLKIICLQWPTWTGSFDPDALSTSDLQPVIEGLGRGRGNQSLLAALTIAGLESKTEGRVRPRTSSPSKRVRGDTGNDERRA